MHSTSSPDLPDDPVLADLKADHPAARVFVAGLSGARTVACFEQGRCMLYYEGETDPPQKTEVLRQAMAAGITDFENGMLIDFTRFTGVIDWDYSKLQENVAPGFPFPSKVAYLVPNTVAAMYAKGILSFSKQTEWKVCVSLEEAECWLGWN